MDNVVSMCYKFHWTKSIRIADNVSILNKTNISSVSIHPDNIPI